MEERKTRHKPFRLRQVELDERYRYLLEHFMLTRGIKTYTRAIRMIIEEYFDNLYKTSIRGEL